MKTRRCEVNGRTWNSQKRLELVDGQKRLLLICWWLRNEWNLKKGANWKEAQPQFVVILSPPRLSEACCSFPLALRKMKGDRVPTYWKVKSVNIIKSYAGSRSDASANKKRKYFRAFYWLSYNNRLCDIHWRVERKLRAACKIVGGWRKVRERDEIILYFFLLCCFGEIRFKLEVGR